MRRASDDRPRRSPSEPSDEDPPPVLLLSPLTEKGLRREAVWAVRLRPKTARSWPPVAARVAVMESCSEGMSTRPRDQAKLVPYSRKTMG